MCGQTQPGWVWPHKTSVNQWQSSEGRGRQRARHSVVKNGSLRKWSLRGCLGLRKIRSPRTNISEQPRNIWTYPEELFVLPCVQVYHCTKLEGNLFNLCQLWVDVLCPLKGWYYVICRCATMPEATTASSAPDSVARRSSRHGYYTAHWGFEEKPAN